MGATEGQGLFGRWDCVSGGASSNDVLEVKESVAGSAAVLRAAPGLEFWKLRAWAAAWRRGTPVLRGECQMVQVFTRSVDPSRVTR
jgi:hypothetical protein